MPTPNFDAVIDALRAPGLFAESGARSTARAQSETYARKLREAFDRQPPAEKNAIEAGLAAGVVLTGSGRQRRMALLAVVVAELLMKRRRAADIPAIRLRYEPLPLDALKRALVAQFPVLFQDPHRAAWEPQHFTQPATLPDLTTPRDWTLRPVPQYRFLVHMNDDLTKPLWNDPAAELARYGGSSFSLMSNEKPYVYSNVGMAQGVIFAVPAANVLVTYRADLMTALHSGTLHTGAGGHTFSDEMLELIAATGADGVASPQMLLDRTHRPTAEPSVGLVTGSRYNEVVVCGKNLVPLPWGQTGELKVVGLFMLITKRGALVQPYNAPERQRLAQAHANRLGTPLLYLPQEP